MNEMKRKEPEAAEPRPKRKRLAKLHDFDFRLNRENAPRLIPFVLYMCLWIIVYIANHHYGEKTLGRIDKVRKEVKDLKADFQTINAELSSRSIQSEVVNVIGPTGLKELTEPPQRIKVPQDEHKER